MSILKSSIQALTRKAFLAVGLLGLSSMGYAACTVNGPSTYTNRAGIKQPAINNCSWGTDLNNDFGIIDSSFGALGSANTWTSTNTFNQPVIIGNAKSLKFFDNTTHSINFQAPATAVQTNFTLPGSDGSNGQALTTNGAGILSFGTISGTSIYPASSTANFPFGLSASTVVVTGLSTNQCVQTNGSGQLISSGGNCGGGSGGSSALQITNNGVQITSPTASVNFSTNFTLAAIGSTSTVNLSQTIGQTETFTSSVTVKNQVSVSQTNTGAVNAVVVTSTGTGIPLQVIGQGSPGGGVQQRQGYLTIGDQVNGKPTAAELVIVSSRTDAQVGAGHIELWADGIGDNDPMYWEHRASNNSAPDFRVDAPAPNMEVISISSSGATNGRGKWEPWAIPFQSEILQVNSRCWDQTSFENVAYWEPLSIQPSFAKPGLYLRSSDSTGCDSGIITSSNTAGVNFFTVNSHTIGITGPLNVASGSWRWRLPHTLSNHGQMMYEETQDASGDFPLEFTVGGSSQQVLTNGGTGAPYWSTVSGGGGASSLQVTQSGVQITSPTASLNYYSGDFVVSAIGTSTSSIILNPATTDFIQNNQTTTVQTATAYISSATINGPLYVKHGGNAYLTITGSNGATQPSVASNGNLELTYGSGVTDFYNSTVNALTGPTQQQASALALRGVPLYFKQQNSGNNYVSLIASQTVTTTQFVLPNADGSSGQALITDGSRNLSFSSISSGSGSPLQVTQGGVQITSPTLSMNFQTNQFSLAAVGSTSTIALNASSVTLQGQNVALLTAPTGTQAIVGSVSLSSTIAITNGISTGLASTVTNTPLTPAGVTQVFGLAGNANWTGNAATVNTAASITGVNGSATIVGPGTVPNAYGGNFTAINGSTTGVTNIAGIKAIEGNNAGLAVNAYGIYAQSSNNVGSTTTFNYGLYIAPSSSTSSGLITTDYGIYIDTQSATTAYGIYQVPNGGQNILSTTTVQKIALGNVASGTQCLHADASGNVTGTGSDCGSGGSGITALTGDVTASGTGSVAATAAALQNNITTFGSSVTFTNANGIRENFGIIASSISVSSLTAGGQVTANTFVIGNLGLNNTGVFFQNGQTLANTSAFKWNGTTMTATNVAGTGNFNAFGATLVTGTVGISSNTIITSSGTGNALQVNASGNFGANDGVSGGALFNCSDPGTQGPCIQIYSNQNSQQNLTAPLYLVQNNTGWDNPSMYIVAKSTSPQNGLRIDANDYSTLALIDTLRSNGSKNGKFQFSSHNNELRGERRNSANNAFESAWVVDSSTGVGIISFATDYSRPVSTVDVQGSMGVGKSIAGLIAAPVNGLLVQGNITTQSSMSVTGGPLGIINTSSANSLTITTNTTGINLVAISSSPAVVPQDFLLNVSSTSGTVVFGVQNNSHVISSGTTPSVSSCGTSPSMNTNSTDFAGTINVGSVTATSCVLTFANAFVNTPTCVVSDDNTGITADISSITNSAVTFGFSISLAGGHVYYICVGQKG